VGGAEYPSHEAPSTGPGLMAAAIDVCAAIVTITVSVALRRNDRSEARFIDLDRPRRPPDLPAAIVRPHIVAGGKS
jgi:hypothetical protein